MYYCNMRSRPSQPLKTGGYESLSKCVTESAALNLKSSALVKKSKEHLLAYVTGVDWKNILALELYYHRSCYKDLTRVVNRPSVDTIKTDGDFKNLFEFV